MADTEASQFHKLKNFRDLSKKREREGEAQGKCGIEEVYFSDVVSM